MEVVAYGKARCEALLRGFVVFALLEPLDQSRVMIEKFSPSALLREKGEVPDVLDGLFEARDDGVAEVLDEKCHGGQCDQTPDHEERPSCVALRRDIPIANR